MAIPLLKATSFTVLFSLLIIKCLADPNLAVGTMCSQSDPTTENSTFKTNLNNLLSSLAANAPLDEGSYKTSSGKNRDKLYGFIQCRGDLSSNQCLNCTKASIDTTRGCPKSKEVTVLRTWCILSYSDEKVPTTWEQSGTASYNKTDYEDPFVVQKGLSFMGSLSNTAPNRPLKFDKGVIDVGGGGKRYGMAQCRRDISKSDCGKCLDQQLVTFKAYIENKRGWDIYGSSCSMWYHDYHFYFGNTSVTASKNLLFYFYFYLYLKFTYLSL